MEKYIFIIAHQANNIRIFRKEMVLSFVERGYKIAVISQGASKEDYDYFNKESIKYFEVSFERTGKNFLKDINYKKSLIKILKQYKEMCVAVFTIAAKPNIYGSLAAQKVGIDCFPLISGLGTIFRGDGPKIRMIRPFFSLLYKIALKKDKCIFVHNKDDLYYLKKHRIIKKQKIVVLNGSGVNTRLFAFEKMPSSPSFLFVGRIIADKGVCEYISACKKIQSEFKNVKCSIVGGFDDNPSMITRDEFFNDINNSDINYYGYQDNVLPFLKSHAVFVLPSYHEGLPKSVIEAMSVGRAIITTDAPGCRETVEKNKNGILIPAKDDRALYEAMKWMIMNYDKTLEMGKESRAIAEKKFDSSIINAMIIEAMKI